MMADSKDPRLTMFELYLATAEKVSDRRAQANAWMLSVNSAIVALYGYLQADKAPIPPMQKPIWLWAIPTAGAIACIAWGSLIMSYRKLNGAKFSVLQKLEAELGGARPFMEEREAYSKEGRVSLAVSEAWIPRCFLLLFIALIGANFLH
jgi:hypothetical protein